MELTFEEIRKLQQDTIKLAVVAEYLSDQSMPAMAHTVFNIVSDINSIVAEERHY